MYDYNLVRKIQSTVYQRKKLENNSSMRKKLAMQVFAVFSLFVRYVL